MSPVKINKLKNYIENIGKHYNVPFLDDYVQEVFLAVFEKGNDFIIELESNDKLKAYTYKVALYQLLSVNSPYYITYILPNSFKDLSGLETYKNECFKEEKLMELVNSLEGVDKILLQQLIECRGVRTIFAKKSKIHYTSLLKMIDRLNEKIKNNWQINEFYG
tara:strand:+ start:445 stop:933 length:489 start_codon:yes stop_codon:yes gene_type:complete